MSASNRRPVSRIQKEVELKILLALIPAVFGIGALVVNIIGIVECFQAHVFLGIVSLFLQGSGVAEWIGNAFFHYDIARHLAAAFHLG